MVMNNIMKLHDRITSPFWEWGHNANPNWGSGSGLREV